MTEEQIKFYFNAVFRYIQASPNGVNFGELVEYALVRKLDDDMFMAMLDQLEKSDIVIRVGETYSTALERV